MIVCLCLCLCLSLCDDDDDDDDGDVVFVHDDDTDDEPQYPDVFSGGSTPESARERQRAPKRARKRISLPSPQNVFSKKQNVSILYKN